MDGFGKQDFLAGEDGGKAASSNPNFHSIPVPWDELYTFDLPLSILRELNRQQSGHPGGTSSDVEMALRNTMGELNREKSGHPGGTSSDVEMALRNTMGELNREKSGHPGGTTSDVDMALRNTMGELNRQQSGRLGGTNSDAERALKKRETDRRYREKLREAKLQMKNNMDSLYVENENLKKENERLQRENVSMNETLQAQTKLIHQLKNDLDELNDEYKKQNVLVQRLSEPLASCPDLQLENERLKLENGQLRHFSSLDYNMVLADKNVKLKLENKVLRVQNDALCGKLISDGDKKHA